MKPVSLALSLVAACLLASAVAAQAQTLPRFGLVYGSDDSLRAAKTEIDRFNTANPDFRSASLASYANKAAVFLRSGRYRSLLLFDTDAKAKAALPVVASYLAVKDRQAGLKIPGGRRPYVVNLSVFCPRWFLNRDQNNDHPAIPLFVCR
jgi:hypothetical protein